MDKNEAIRIKDWKKKCINMNNWSNVIEKLTEKIGDNCLPLKIFIS
jgi:hypothetical protein